MSGQSISPAIRPALASGQSRRSTDRALLSEHGPVLSVVLHLLPGVLTGAVYLLLRQPVSAAGYPSLVALYLSIPLGLAPIGLGLIVYLGFRRNLRLSLKGVVLYRDPIQLRRYFVYVPLVFAISLIVILIGQKVLDAALQTALFGWMPVPDYGLSGAYSRSVLIVSYMLVAISLPLEVVVEELYFRGFLLPRMRYSGRWTTPLHSFLYALYHVWIPWRLVTLAVGMTPLVFAVRRTRNIYVGMIAHALLDSFYVIFGVAFILGMR